MPCENRLCISAVAPEVVRELLVDRQRRAQVSLGNSCSAGAAFTHGFAPVFPRPLSTTSCGPRGVKHAVFLPRSTPKDLPSFYWTRLYHAVNCVSSTVSSLRLSAQPGGSGVWRASPREEARITSREPSSSSSTPEVFPPNRRA